jgi:hypothetical protein
LLDLNIPHIAKTKHDINRQQTPLLVNDPYHPASRACRRIELGFNKQYKGVGRGSGKRRQAAREVENIPLA